MKFDNVFGSNPGQAPADKTVTKAWLAITTGVSDDNRSPGPFSVHPMLRDWDTTTLYSSFGAVPGLQEADGDIGAVLDSNLGMINGAESWFDVTSYLEAIRNGAKILVWPSFPTPTMAGGSCSMAQRTQPYIRDWLFTPICRPPAFWATTTATAWSMREIM